MQFTQNEVEQGLSDILKNGDRREISRITGIYESVIKGMLNADDERKSYTFGFLQIQCALDEIDPERGEQHWQKVKEFRELSKKRHPGVNTEICPHECLLKKLHLDGETSAELADCLKDGEINIGEINGLRLAVARIRDNCDLMDTMLDFYEAGLNKANGATRSANR